MQNIARLSREEFLDWVALGGHSSAATKRKRQFVHESGLQQGEVGVISDDNDPAKKSIIVLRDADIKDFFAWVSTYISTLSPLTAFYRVVTESQIARLDLFDDRPPLIDDDTLDSLAAVVIAEAVGQTNGFARPLANLSLSLCKATLSYPLLSSACQRYHPLAVGEITSSWLSARSYTGFRELRISPDLVQAFWLLVLSSLLPGGPLIRSVASSDTELLQNLIQGASRGTAFEALNAAAYVKRAVRNFDPRDFSGNVPREDQVRSLDRLADGLYEGDTSPIVRDAIVGYFSATMGNGSMEFLPLMGEFAPRFPTVALWYALFAIWESNFDGLSAGRCLGRRLARDVPTLASPLAPPSADIGLQEFEQLMEMGRGGWVRSDATSSVVVELVPNVCTRIGLGGGQARNGSDAPSDADILRLRRLLDQARRILDGSSGAGSASRAGQDDMFRDAEAAPRRAPKPRKP